MPRIKNKNKGLVLAVKENESIMLLHKGIEINVTVIDCESGKVRLLFSAPLAVVIFRESVLIANKQRSLPNVKN